jgi:hypothetical protein
VFLAFPAIALLKINGIVKVVKLFACRLAADVASQGVKIAVALNRHGFIPPPGAGCPAPLHLFTFLPVGNFQFQNSFCTL